jgi:RNA polymerase sigma-70 factor (ECF subfamily)
VFVVAHRRLDDFRGGASPRTWLYAIARRVASNYRRSAPVRRESSLEEDAVEDLVADGSGPERAAMDAEARAQLEIILSEMDLEKRAVFVMFEVELLPAAEIAEITGVPVSTVHSRLASARKLFERGLRRMNLLTEIKETES